MNNKIPLYSDASTREGISIIAYKIGDNKIVVKKIDQPNNTQAEIQAAIELLEEVEKIEKIGNGYILYCDCDKILRLSKKIQIAKDEQELKLIKLLISTNTNVERVKGHSKKIEKDNIDIEFQKVDKLARKTLRNHYKSK